MKHFLIGSPTGKHLDFIFNLGCWMFGFGWSTRYLHLNLGPFIFLAVWRPYNET